MIELPSLCTRVHEKQYSIAPFSCQYCDLFLKPWGFDYAAYQALAKIPKLRWSTKFEPALQHLLDFVTTICLSATISSEILDPAL